MTTAQPPTESHTRWARRVRWVLGAIAVILALVLLAGPYVLANLVAHPPWLDWRSPEEGLGPIDSRWAESIMLGKTHDPQTDWGIAYETVEFPTEEGMTLRGWWVPPPEPTDAVIVFVHGGGSDRRSWLPHLPIFHEAGYGALLFDCRDQGISDGKGRGMSFGVREHADVIAAVRYVRETYGARRVAAIGTCHGSPSSILAASRDLDIDLVIVEDPNTTFDRALTDTEMLDVLPDWFVARIVRIITDRAGRGDLPDPIDAIADISPRPLFIIHAAEDNAVSPEQSRELFAKAGEPKELWIVDGAKHSGAYAAQPEEYKRRVIGFLDKYMPAQAPAIAVAAAQ